MAREGAARYALLGCLLLLFSAFSTYMLHIKVGLDHNKQLRVSQIVAADTAWAGQVLMDIAHEIDEEFVQIGQGIEEGLGFSGEGGDGVIVVNGGADQPGGDLPAAAVTTTLAAPSHHVTTNGPLRVAPGIVWVVPAFKRSWTLQLVLESLTRAGAADSTIVVSQDANDAGVRQVAQDFVKSGDLPKLRLVSHPWSCARHPHSFPGDDPELNKGYKGDSYVRTSDSCVACHADVGVCFFCAPFAGVG